MALFSIFQSVVCILNFGEAGKANLSINKEEITVVFPR